MGAATLLELKDFHFAYGKTPVLKGVSVAIEKGTVQGLLGANGSGKTTFFDALFEMHRFGNSIIFPQNLPARTAYLPTHNFFYSYMTGAEYLRIVSPETSLQQIAEWNGLFELPLDQYAQHYSTGMQKKLALLGVLLQDKDFLMLDEPFNGLDLSACELLKTIILRLRERNKTILLSSHIYETLTGCCDHIAVLENGKISGNFSREAYPLLTQKIAAQFREAQAVKVDALLGG